MSCLRLTSGRTHSSSISTRRSFTASGRHASLSLRLRHLFLISLIAALLQRDKGWVTRRRPGVDYFLAYLSNYYEIVIFSQEQPFYADPIITKLDPQGYVMYRLFRDSTQYENGVHIKVRPPSLPLPLSIGREVS